MTYHPIIFSISNSIDDFYTGNHILLDDEQIPQSVMERPSSCGNLIMVRNNFDERWTANLRKWGKKYRLTIRYKVANI